MQERLPLGGCYVPCASSFPAAGIVGSRAGRVEDALRRRCAAGLRPVLDPATRSHGMAAAREKERRGS